jgi:N-acyl-D-amino-acid deacylase
LLHEEGNVGMIIFSMSDEDISEIISWDYSMIISDSLYISKGLPHPRLYGSFPRIISKYVISDKVIPIEEAIKKMSSMPAKKFNIKNKGEIRVGYDADVVIFDKNKFTDNATYTEPAKYASGIDYVFMGGEVALMNDEITNTSNGGLIKNSFA